MIKIRTWQDLLNAQQNHLFPDALQAHLESEFQMLHEHLANDIDLNQFNLTAHGTMTVLCPADRNKSLKSILKQLPGAWPEFVEASVLPSGFLLWRGGWLVDNDCCELAYFPVQYLHRSVRNWLKKQAACTETATTYPDGNPF